VMVVVLKKDAAASPGELIRFCEDKLARYKMPKRIVFAESLQTSPYGKVMKKELKAMFAKEESDTQ
jgi:acyl-CoA synthetase (AMP-forming)/AMP-acid ligase II